MHRRIVLASAFTPHQKISQIMKRGGIWVYAGRNIEKFKQFQKDLPQDVLHASPAEFREFTRSKRDVFVQWTEKIHSKYGYELSHWLSNTFSLNPYDNLYYYSMKLAWFHDIIKFNSNQDIAFIAESHALLLIAEEVASKYTNNKIYKYGFSKEKLRWLYRVCVSSTLGVFRELLFFIVRYIFSCVYKNRKKNIECRKITTIVETYIFENSFNRNGKFINKYFTELHELLNQSGIAVGIYPVFLWMPIRKLKTIFKSIRQNKIFFVLLEDYLKPADYLKAVIYSLKCFAPFEKVEPFLGINIQPLVDEENWVKISSKDFLLSLLIHRLPKRLRENRIVPAVFINWGENQTIHRAIVSGFHKYLPETEVVGGKSFFPPLNHLNLFNTINERKYGFAPDRIVTCGSLLKKVFSIYDDDCKYEVGASFRYGYLWNLVNGGEHTYSKDINEYKIVSLVLPYSKSISTYILLSLKKAIRNVTANGWNVRIKSHPSYMESDLTELINLIKVNNMQSEYIEFTSEDLATLLPKSSAIITSASSSAVEAICLGIPVVSVGMPIGLDLNMLDYLPSPMWKIAYTDDEIDFGLNKWALKHPLPISERRKMGLRILEDTFEPNTKELMWVYARVLKDKTI